jgi:tripartite-type tricarboxylate transporter receptor subunit TctC
MKPELSQPGRWARRLDQLNPHSPWKTFGRPYMMAPGVPADRVATLRSAFMETMRNPDLLAEAKQIGIEIEPISGEELQALSEKIFATPAAVVEQAKQAMEYRAP